jgi:hypothetical protein
MSAAKALLERMGLLAPKRTDLFDTRLARIRRRERRHRGAVVLFRNPPSPAAA